MLIDIAKLPTAENSAIHLHPADNVAVARVPIPAGAELRVDGADVVALDAIPAGHKIALRAIHAGEKVERYGQCIGRATAEVAAGRHVHTHNLGFEELALDYEFPSVELPLPKRTAEPTFMGYVREDGRVGTRNYIAVVAASNCAAHTAELIAESYLGENSAGQCRRRGGVSARRRLRRMRSAPDMDQLRRTLGGVLAHPNVVGRGDSGPRLRDQPDRALSGGCTAPRAAPPRRA